MSQGHADHAHGHAHDHRSAPRRALALVLVLTLGMTAVEIAGPDGTPGTDWDKLTLTSISITANSGNRFTIVLTPLSGFLATHNPNEGGRWVIASYTSIDGGNGFDVDKFTVDTSALDPSLNIGGFYVRATSLSSAGDLELIYVPEPTGGVALLLAASLGLGRSRGREAPTTSNSATATS